MTSPRLFAIVAFAALAGCAGNVLEPSPDPGPGDDDPGPDDPTDPGPDPLCTVEARSYVGFGQAPLEADRGEAIAGSDRLRVKPFGALAGEYQRVLGVAVDTGAFADTFGAPPPRWYEEPAASANTLYGAYSMAYAGCLEYTATGAQFAEAPTAATADALCRDFGRAFWDREPTDDQASACATFAVGETAGAGGPRARWAYACAAALTTADFLTF